jgi:hypothetical protein
VDKGSVWIGKHLQMYDTKGRICVVDSISMITEPALHDILLSTTMHGFINIDARFSGSTSFGFIVSTATAAENGTGIGIGKAQEVAREKLRHWIYFGVSVSQNAGGALRGEVLYADTQNGMEQGHNRHHNVLSAAQALAVAVSKEMEKVDAAL